MADLPGAIYDSLLMRRYLMEDGFTDLHIYEKGTTIGMSHFLLDSLRTMWQRKELFDYTIKVGEKEFHVHKIVLAAFSDYFRRMFCGSLKESEQDSIHLKGVSAAGLEPILKLIYEGEHLDVTEENVVDTLNAASFLQMPIVMHLCVHAMKTMVDADNCIDILNLTFMYSLHGPDIGLIEKVMVCLQSNWKQVLEEGHIIRLCHDALNYVLSQTTIAVSYYELFRAIMKWVAHHMPEEKATDAQRDKLYETLQLIHFPLMTDTELTEILETCPFILSDARCCQLVAEAQIYKSKPINQQIVSSSPRTTVNNDPCVFAFCGNIVDENTDLPTNVLSHESFAYVEKTCEWQRLPLTEFTFTRAGVTVVNNFLIVCGGYGSRSTVGDECYVYDPRVSKWSSLAPMNCVRQNFSLVHCSGKLYAIGGTCNDTVECYDFETDKWSLHDHMDTMLWDQSACEYDDEIYVSGGLEGFGNATDRLRKYNPETKTWEEKAQMLSSAFGHTMITRINYYQEGGSSVDKYLFVFNASADDMSHWGSVTRYNPETNQWALYNLWVMPGKAQIVPMSDKVYYINGEAKASRVIGPTDEDDIDDDGIVSGVCVCLEGTIETSRYQTHERIPRYPKRMVYNPLCCALTFPADILATASPVTKHNSFRNLVHEMQEFFVEDN